MIGTRISCNRSACSNRAKIVTYCLRLGFQEIGFGYMSVCRGGALLILGENTASYAQHSNNNLRRSHGVLDPYAHLELVVHISKGPGLCSSLRINNWAQVNSQKEK